MGEWYELEKYPNTFQNGDCGVANYVLEDGGVVTVNNTERKPDGAASTAIGQVIATEVDATQCYPIQTEISVKLIGKHCNNDNDR